MATFTEYLLNAGKVWVLSTNRTEYVQSSEVGIFISMC